MKLSINFVLGPTGDIRKGAARTTLELARRFQERGHNVSLTTWPEFMWQGKSPFPGMDFAAPIYFDKSTKPESLPLKGLEQTPRDYLGELEYFTAFLNLVTPAIPKADIIVAGSWEAVIPVWQSGRGKAVHFLHNYEEIGFTLDSSPSTGLRSNPLIKLLCRSALQMPVYRVANSSWLAAECKRRFQESVPYVQHGVDAACFRPLPKRSETDGIIRVVTYCRPEKFKGFQDAAPAMHELMKRYPGKIEWHVFGFEHPELGAQNELAPYKFHGALQHKELAKLYAESDIVLCPSWAEGFSLTALEAMASGTPVVTTRYGTEDFAIDGFNAIVVRPRIVSDFVVALDGLVRVPEMRRQLARNGRAMAESLSWENAVETREELLIRIHKNEISHNALRGFDTGITDGYGIPFEHLTADARVRDGEMLQGADGEQYIVEGGRLRRLDGVELIAPASENARVLDLLSLLRNEQGPSITSNANYYGMRVN